MIYANVPFNKRNELYGRGLTAWVRKALETVERITPQLVEGSAHLGEPCDIDAVEAASGVDANLHQPRLA